MALRSSHVEELYARARAPLTRSVVRIAGDDAPDLVQEAFLSYLQHGHGVLRPEAWLSRVTKNKALNAVRRAPSVELEDRAAGDDPTAEVDRTAVRSVMARAMGELPERSARAIKLRFFDEATYEDIARVLDCSTEQARVVVHRSVRRLGRRLVHLLASERGAAACIPALERATGMSREEAAHKDCGDCRSVLDEIAALRLVPGLFPVGLREAFARLAARFRDVPAALPAAIGGLAVVIGLSGGPTPAQEPRLPRPVVRAADASPVVSAGNDNARTRDLVAPAEASVDDSRGTAPTAERTVTKAGPVTVRQGEKTTRVEAGGEGAPKAGAAACEPLQPCRPSFGP